MEFKIKATTRHIQSTTEFPLWIKTPVLLIFYCNRKQAQFEIVISFFITESAMESYVSLCYARREPVSPLHWSSCRVTIASPGSQSRIKWGGSCS